LISGALKFPDRTNIRLCMNLSLKIRNRRHLTSVSVSISVPVSTISGVSVVSGGVSVVSGVSGVSAMTGVSKTVTVNVSMTGVSSVSKTMMSVSVVKSGIGFGIGRTLANGVVSGVSEVSETGVSETVMSGVSKTVVSGVSDNGAVDNRGHDLGNLGGGVDNILHGYAMGNGSDGSGDTVSMDSAWLRLF